MSDKGGEMAVISIDLKLRFCDAVGARGGQRANGRPKRIFSDEKGGEEEMMMIMMSAKCC